MSKIYFVKEILFNRDETEFKSYCHTLDKEKAVAKYNSILDEMLHKDTFVSYEMEMYAPDNYTVVQDEGANPMFSFDNAETGNSYILRVCEDDLV